MSTLDQLVRRSLASLTLAAVALPLASPAMAEAVTFDFKDPKGVNAVSFVLDSKLEPIVGMGAGIAGEVTFDPEDPAAISGTITLSAEGLDTSNPRMTSVMQGADWLGISDHPIVTFTMKSAEVTATVEDAVELHVTGDLTLVGITQEVTVPVLATHLPDMAAARGGAESGDLLVLRSTMVVDRTAFGIKPDMGPDVVAEMIEIEIPIVGYSK